MNDFILTGVRGFLGSAVFEYIVRHFKDARIAVIERDITLKLQLKYDVEVVTWSNLDLLIGRKAVVIHMANSKLEKENQEMINNLHYLITRLNRANVVFISSVSVYGSGYRCINSSSIPSPDSQYGWMKLYGESRIMDAVSQMTGSQCTLIRSSAILGKNMPETFVRRLWNACKESGEIRLSGENCLFNNCMNVESMVLLIVKAALGEGSIGHVYVTGSHSPMRLGEIIGYMMDQIGLDKSMLSFKSDKSIKSFYIDSEFVYQLPKEIQISTQDCLRRFVRLRI